MIRGRKSGSNTKTGLIFECEVDFLSLLKQIPGYDIKKVTQRADHEIYHQGNLIPRCFKKHQFYTFLEEHDIDWRKIISRQLLPNVAVIIRETLFIIEVKYQQGEGYVNEK